MATLASLVDDTYDILYGIAQVERPAEDTLSTTVDDDADVAWRFTTAAMWKRGDYAAAADTAAELVIMAGDHPSGASDVTVRRAQKGTTAKVAGYAAGDVFYKNPKFRRAQLERAINEVIRHDLWPHVWSWHQGTVTWTAGDHTYSMPQYVEDVVHLYQVDINGDGTFNPIDRDLWDVERQLDTNVATNKNLFRLRWAHDEAATVYYTGKRRPHPDDVATLADELADMVPYAAAGKLMLQTAPRKRVNPQRQDKDRVEGGEARDYRGLMAEFLRMRSEYGKQLRLEVRPEPKFRQRRRVGW